MLKVIGMQGCSRCNAIKNILNNKKIEFEYSLVDDLEENQKEYYMSSAKDNGFVNFPWIIDEENKFIEIGKLQYVL